MTAIHPFSIKTERDLLNEARFRWMLCEGDQVIIRSPHSYATRREAEQEADKVMQNHAAKARANR
jgi:hypothetical protein